MKIFSGKKKFITIPLAFIIGASLLPTSSSNNNHQRVEVVESTKQVINNEVEVISSPTIHVEPTSTITIFLSPTSRPQVIAPTKAPDTLNFSSGTNTSGGTCKFSCSGPDKDCSDFSTYSEAQASFNCCGFSSSYDPMKLDSARNDGNGLACEST